MKMFAIMCAVMALVLFTQLADAEPCRGGSCQVPQAKASTATRNHAVTRVRIVERRPIFQRTVVRQRKCR